MKRTPFRTRPSSERDWASAIARRIEQQEKAQTRAKDKRTRVPKDQIICGMAWPAKYVPEEPTKGYETCFRYMVQDLAHVHGWTFWHDNDPTINGRGFPDLLLIRERVIWRELKVRDPFGRANTIDVYQKAFLSRLALAGADAAVWTYPDSWEELVKELARI